MQNGWTEFPKFGACVGGQSDGQCWLEGRGRIHARVGGQGREFKELIILLPRQLEVGCDEAPT